MYSQFIKKDEVRAYHYIGLMTEVMNLARESIDGWPMSLEEKKVAREALDGIVINGNIFQGLMLEHIARKNGEKTHGNCC